MPRDTYKLLLDLLTRPEHGAVGFWLELLWPALIGAPVPSAAFAERHVAEAQRLAPVPLLSSLTNPRPTVAGIAPRPPACGNELLLLLRARCMTRLWDDSMCDMDSGRRLLLHVLTDTSRTSINTTHALLTSVLPVRVRQHAARRPFGNELTVRYDARDAVSLWWGSTP